MKQKGNLAFFVFCVIGLVLGTITHFVTQFFLDIGNYTILAGIVVFFYVLYIGMLFEKEGKNKMLSVLIEHLFKVVFGSAIFAVSIWLAGLTGLKGLSLFLAWNGILIVLCIVGVFFVVLLSTKNKKREKL